MTKLRDRVASFSGSLVTRGSSWCSGSGGRHDHWSPTGHQEGSTGRYAADVALGCSVENGRSYVVRGRLSSAWFGAFFRS
jgi:hypothetical protein